MTLTVGLDNHPTLRTAGSVLDLSVGGLNVSSNLVVATTAQANNFTPVYSNIGASPTTFSTGLWVTPGSNVTVYANGSMTKTGGTNSSWDSVAYTSDAFTTCYASATVGYGTANYAMLGLLTSSNLTFTGSDYTNFSHAIYDAGGSIQIYEGGVGGNTSTGITCATGDTLRVIYNGTNVTYWHNSTQVWANGTSANSVHPGQQFHIGAVFYYTSSATQFQNVNAETTYTLNCANGDYQDIALSNNIQLTLTNAAPSGKVTQQTLIVRQANPTYGACGLAFANTIRWSDNNIPVLGSVANTADVLQFFTYDGGTVWIGAQVASNLPSMNIY
jgi:hypothetical protein